MKQKYNKHFNISCSHAVTYSVSPSISPLAIFSYNAALASKACLKQMQKGATFFH